MVKPLKEEVLVAAMLKMSMNILIVVTFPPKISDLLPLDMLYETSVTLAACIAGL
jgi:hypothetical protein